MFPEMIPEIAYRIIELLGYSIGAVATIYEIIEFKIKKNKFSLVAAIFGVLFLTIFSFILNDYVRVPRLDYNSIDSAKQVLAILDLDYFLEDETMLSHTEESAYIVRYKDSDIVGMYARKGTVLELTIEYENPLSADAGLSMPENQEVQQSVEENISNFGDAELSISIDSWDYMEEKKGIAGTFSYSRELTEYEKNHSGHTGGVYDSRGNDLSESEYQISFWSDLNGEFVVELPDDLPSGEYTYELILIIGDQWVNSSVSFVY